MSQPGAGVVTCTQCGAENTAVAPVCWLCSQSFSAPSVSKLSAASVPVRRPSPGGGATFSLATLMLVMTLVGLCAAVFKVAPGLAIFLAIFALPAFIRTNLILKRRAASGEESNMVVRAVVFAGSLATVITVTVIVIVVSVGSFCAVCLTTVGTRTLTESTAIFVSLIVSLVTTIAVIFGLVAFFRSRRRSYLKKYPPIFDSISKSNPPDPGPLP